VGNERERAGASGNAVTAPGSGPAAAGSGKSPEVPDVSLLLERLIGRDSTRSRHLSAGMATAR
jgi:hypothetical protein